MSEKPRKKDFFKPGYIILFLALCVSSFLIYYSEFGTLEVLKVMQISFKGNQQLNLMPQPYPQPKGKTMTSGVDGKQHVKINTSSTLRASTEPLNPRNNCSYQSLTPEEALEFESLRDLLYWPETPRLESNFSLKDSSSPARSTLTVIQKNGTWRVGDELEVWIQIRDFHGRPKKSGGDVMLARLHNPALRAGVVGKVLDHLNGSYTAVFPLLWEGAASVEIMMVHSSEAVTVLRKMDQKQPDRVFFKSVFGSGTVRTVTTCNVCLHAAKEDLCNFTDIRTGEPWFCYKPKGLTCNHRMAHSMGGYRHKANQVEKSLFIKKLNLKVKILASRPKKIAVFPKLPGANQTTVRFTPVGYYYQGAWQALDGTTVQHFNSPAAMSRCLKGKVVHLYGDSTVRQWFEFLIGKLPGLKKFDLKHSNKTGPFIALDYENNILVTFRLHGPPIRSSPVPISELRYVANEIDGVAGGPNTVVVFGVWAHYGSFPAEVYVRRLLNIRKAVVQLLVRSPDTLVIIRTANPKGLSFNVSVSNSDWFSLQRDKLLRKIFEGLNVRFLDAWEMTLAHYLPHNLHPPPPIIKNMIDVILSYTCPKQ